ncbi:MAG TPA: AAA family ATPase [Anaerolineales bacterium]|nr:AAA family ATPase [Anaerolineales bacterium]
MEPPSNKPLIGIVGPCGSGKSTLSAGLQQHGYACRHIAQEHSYVPAMWQKISNPDVLIYLNASFPVSTARRRLNWQKQDHDEQLRRLDHARRHANLLIDTDDLTPEQVLQKVLDYLKEINS